MLARQIERVRRARRLSGIVVATSIDASDDVIAAWCASADVRCWRGPLNDVRARFLGALADAGEPRTFARLTADCPLADPALIDAAVASHTESGADYTYNTRDWTWPKGLDVEICETAALRRAAAESDDPYDREHVTPYIYRHPERFRINALSRDPPLRYRWTVDTAEDFAFVTAVYEALYADKPDFDTDDILAWQDAHPEQALPNLVS
jgi:spore coat polysaccharide biosynthesis protein SpsF